MEAAGSGVAGPEVAGTEVAGTGKAGPAPRWRFLISRRWLAWHAFAVVAFWGMCWLGDWQLHRAIAGNSLSWAYTFEWPLFAIMGAVFWARTIRDELRIRGAPATEAAEGGLSGAAERGRPLGAEAAERAPVRPEGVNDPPATPADVPGGAGEPGDLERAADNAYLAMLNEQVKGHGRWHGLR
jgi:hypothetical protein